MVSNYSYKTPHFTDYSSGIIFGIMVSGLFTLFEVIQESKEAKQAAELKFRALENEKLKAQVSALTAQMNTPQAPVAPVIAPAVIAAAVTEAVAAPVVAEAPIETETMPEPQPEPTPEQTKEEEDLYSVKNFSL